jgi:hypothetical protein
MNKNKDFFPNNLLFKNHPNAITYSIFRIKVSEQFSDHFVGIFMVGKMNVNYQFFTYYEALASKMNNKISLPL